MQATSRSYKELAFFGPWVLVIVQGTCRVATHGKNVKGWQRISLSIFKPQGQASQKNMKGEREREREGGGGGGGGVQNLS